MEEEKIIKEEENNKAEDSLVNGKEESVDTALSLDDEGESVPRVEEETSIPVPLIVKPKIKAKAKAKVQVPAEPETTEPEYVAPKRRGRPKG